MKLKLLLSFLLITGFFTAGSQSLGIRAGANIADLTGDVNGNATLVAWQLGAYVDFEVSENLDLNIAALYAKKGAKDELTNLKAGLSYLEIPLMFRLKISALFIQAGGYGSYLLEASSEGNSIKEFLKSGDYGVNFGAGVSLGNLTFDGRYSIGLANINDVNLDTIRNSVITFGVEFGF